jgi:putative ubiquitin-RnfH superfamily antitoxin RatB of RatAB toxin-antitoxin module
MSDTNIYLTNTQAARILDASAAGRSMLTAADAAAQRTLLSVLSTAEIVAAYQPIGDYATGAEGDLAASAIQPGDAIQVQWIQLQDPDQQGTASIYAEDDSWLFDTNADNGFIFEAAVQFIGGTSGISYTDLINPPTLGTAAAADTGDFAAATHTHSTSDITSGTFADALIAESNVTQHQAALSITESQISDLGTYLTAAAIGVTVQAYDADTAKLDAAQTWSASQIPGSAAITFDSSITDDLDAGPMVKSLTLTGDVTTFAVSNGTNYQIRRYYVSQDGTGSHTITFSGIDGTEPTIDSAANALTVFEIEFVPGTGARFV